MNMLTRLDPPLRADIVSPLPPPGGRETVFAFQSPQGLLHGLGGATALASGPAATLEERLSAAFRAAGADAVVAGALPFDREAPDCLWQAAHVARRPAAAARPLPRPALCRDWRIRHEPDAAGYARAVRRALDIMAEEAEAPDGLRKVVLSRSLLATADRDIDLAALFARLAADPASTAFLVPLPPRGGTSRAMAGATPELLLARNGARIASHPLAGSARRLPGDLAADAAAGAGLLRSRKDRREHAIVVEFILDTLAPWCRRLFRPQGLALTSTASMWHLGTRIEGELKDPDISAAVFAAALHPTPAVCGVPREKAAGHIAALEDYGRDFYAGTVGWCDGRGDGAWYVTIRCAEIAGRQARLFAGAGIVPGSDPLAEAEETGAKFAALLNALDIPPDHEVCR